jgi:hypothetical protein
VQCGALALSFVGSPRVTFFQTDCFACFLCVLQERYTTRINKIMAADNEFKPLHPGSNDLFKIVSDGRWLW